MLISTMASVNVPRALVWLWMCDEDVDSRFSNIPVVQLLNDMDDTHAWTPSWDPDEEEGARSRNATELAALEKVYLFSVTKSGANIKVAQNPMFPMWEHGNLELTETHKDEISDLYTHPTTLLHYLMETWPHRVNQLSLIWSKLMCTILKRSDWYAEASTYLSSVVAKPYSATRWNVRKIAAQVLINLKLAGLLHTKCIPPMDYVDSIACVFVYFAGGTHDNKNRPFQLEGEHSASRKYMRCHGSSGVI